MYPYSPSDSHWNFCGWAALSQKLAILPPAVNLPPALHWCSVFLTITGLGWEFLMPEFLDGSMKLSWYFQTSGRRVIQTMNLLWGVSIFFGKQHIKCTMQHSLYMKYIASEQTSLSLTLPIQLLPMRGKYMFQRGKFCHY